ncbi:MAG TPA: hypothetical protein VEI57_04950, partial [Nitrospirota bacterium]|nr:hypothetical protein [Nitrospirota bacterium]
MSHRMLVNNHKTCTILLDMAWNRRFSGPLQSGTGHWIERFTNDLNPGAWCSEETDIENS